MSRHNEDEIQLGIKMFKKACSDATRTVIPGRPTIWSGKSCEGGGWTIAHKMNEDAMTPDAVARECDLKHILKPAGEAFRQKVLEGARKYVGEITT